MQDRSPFFPPDYSCFLQFFRPPNIKRSPFFLSLIQTTWFSVSLAQISFYLGQLQSHSPDPINISRASHDTRLSELENSCFTGGDRPIDGKNSANEVHDGQSEGIIQEWSGEGSDGPG